MDQSEVTIKAVQINCGTGECSGQTIQLYYSRQRSAELPCCLLIWDPYFQAGSCCWMTHFFFFFFLVIPDLTELCLPIGPPSGCLLEPPSRVCWVVCNYPQASLGQSLKAPLQICCSIHGWTLALGEPAGGGRTHREWKFHISIIRRLIKACAHVDPALHRSLTFNHLPL